MVGPEPQTVARATSRLSTTRVGTSRGRVATRRRCRHALRPLALPSGENDTVSRDQRTSLINCISSRRVRTSHRRTGCPARRQRARRRERDGCDYCCPGSVSSFPSGNVPQHIARLDSHRKVTRASENAVSKIYLFPSGFMSVHGFLVW